MFWIGLLFGFMVWGGGSSSQHVSTPQPEPVSACKVDKPKEFVPRYSEDDPMNLIDCTYVSHSHYFVHDPSSGRDQILRHTDISRTILALPKYCAEIKDSNTRQHQKFIAEGAIK